MNSVIAAPVDWIESVGDLKLPAKADHRLQELMDRNTEGLLSQAERAERFAETMRLIHEKTGCEWKLFGVEKDRAVADTILAAAAIPVTDLIGKTTLAQLMDELRTCDLLLTNDTGTMHLAAHLGVPTVALFGSTEPALTGPLGAHHRVIRHHVECSPCFLRECPIDFRCMKAIEVSEVVAAVLAQLTTSPAILPTPEA